MSLTYRIAKKYRVIASIVTEKELPVLQPTIGEWYAAYEWSEALDNWQAGAIAQYKGDGLWFDGEIDHTREFIWCDFIMPQN